MRELVLSYYFVLRRTLEHRRDLRPCLTRCRHCRIFFLAHPRNRRRSDLGCPFGCRAAHGKKRSAERSAAYYRTPAGKMKKARLNRKRRRAGDPGNDAVEKAADVEVNGAEFSESDPTEADLTEAEFDAEIVEHVRVVVSLIERFDVSREDIIAMLARTVRQRRIVREKRLDYVLSWLTNHPP